MSDSELDVDFELWQFFFLLISAACNQDICPVTQHLKETFFSGGFILTPKSVVALNLLLNSSSGL